MFKEPVLIFQLYTVITESPTVPYRYPHYWKSLTIHCCICVLLSYVEMLHELSKSLISPCKNCMEELHAHMYKGRTLLIYLEGSLRVILFFNLLRFSSHPHSMGAHLWNNFTNKMGKWLDERCLLYTQLFRNAPNASREAGLYSEARSLAWILWCRVRVELRVKALPHLVHL